MPLGKRYKTSGKEWLFHSVTAFNGTKYADKEDPVSFYDSYCVYKQGKRDYHAVELAIEYKDEVIKWADSLINKTGIELPDEVKNPYLRKQKELQKQEEHLKSIMEE